jgi:predicted nucleic acid-binding protein
MSLTESIVEDAALTWFLLRQGYGGQVGELGYAVGHGSTFALLRRDKPQMAPGEPAAERDAFGEVVQSCVARPAWTTARTRRWPSLHEFLAIVTHPKIYIPPTPLNIALDVLRAWQDSPGLRLLGEGPGYFETLAEQVTAGKINGPRIHDARIASICLHHGVKKLWSADRDFTSFPGLACENPPIAWVITSQLLKSLEEKARAARTRRVPLMAASQA